jgi:hypothetical protein
MHKALGNNNYSSLRSFRNQEKGLDKLETEDVIATMLSIDSVARRTEAARYTALQHCQIRRLFLELYKHLSHIYQVAL